MLTQPPAGPSATGQMLVDNDGNGTMVWSASPTFTGSTFEGDVDVDNGFAVRFFEQDDNGDNHIAIKSPNSHATDYTITLPTAVVPSAKLW